MELRELTQLAVILRILAAFLCGGVLGLERGLKNRPAGLRTYMLVCVGSCVIMMTNQFVWQTTGTGDPVRLGAQVVSGIGFLGAGTIIKTHHNQIKGLTTAAGLWSCAAVGLALGIGFYEAAVFAGFAVFFVLTGLHRLDDKMHSSTKVIEIYVELGDDISVGYFIRGVRKLELEIGNIQLEQDGALDEGVRAIVATLKSDKRIGHENILGDIRKIKGVKYLEEL